MVFKLRWLSASCITKAITEEEQSSASVLSSTTLQMTIQWSFLLPHIVQYNTELTTLSYVVLEYLESLESSVRESHLHENGGLQDPVQ